AVKDNGGVVFVPAFSGLYTPHWDMTARGLLIGLTNSTEKGHIIRATYEAISLRTNEVLNSFKSDSNKNITTIKVDGGLSSSKEFLQTQSNISNIEVVKPKESETTIIGSAIVAGLEKDIALWKTEELS